MKVGDIIVHKRFKHEGVVTKIEDGYAEVYFTKIGMYKPEMFHIKDLEVISD